MNLFTFFNALSNFEFCESPHLYAKINIKIKSNRQYRFHFYRSKCDIYESVASPLKGAFNFEH